MQKGSSLIEGIVAIAVILLALLGFLSQANFNFQAFQESQQRLIASNLAREGIELVRNKRDSNWLKGCPDPFGGNCYVWDLGLFFGLDYSFVADFNKARNEWNFDFEPDNLVDCVSNESCRLYVNDNVYQHSISEGRDDFYRLIKALPICKDTNDCNEGVCDDNLICTSEKIGVLIESKVVWFTTSGKEQSVVLKEYLYNWR